MFKLQLSIISIFRKRAHRKSGSRLCYQDVPFPIRSDATNLITSQHSVIEGITIICRRIFQQFIRLKHINAFTGSNPNPMIVIFKNNPHLTLSISGSQEMAESIAILARNGQIKSSFKSSNPYTVFTILQQAKHLIRGQGRRIGRIMCIYTVTHNQSLGTRSIPLNSIHILYNRINITAISCFFLFIIQL